MNTSRRAQWLLTAAVAALPAIAFVSPASAQYQNGQNGHALDASNQAGSGGQNNQAPSNSAVSGNQIVTGNSTGGTSFRGPVPYFDPNTFAGPLASQGNDNFVRDSHGVPTPYAPAFNPYTPRSFYSSSGLTSAPPTGAVMESFQGAVVGTGLGAQNSNNLASPLDAVRDQNLGNTTIYGLAPGTQTNNVTMLPPPGSETDPASTSSLLINPAYQSSQVSPITGEPLAFSVLQPALPNLNDRFNLAQNPSEQLTNPNANITTPGQTSTLPKGNQPPVQPSPNTGTNPTGAPTNAITPNPLTNTLNPAANPSNAENPLAPTSMLNQQPLNTPLNPYGQNPGAANGSMAGSAMNNSLATNQSSRQWLQVPPAQQSTQYRELQTRLEEFNSKHQLTDQEANAQFQRERLLLHPAGAGGGPGGVAANPGPQPPLPSGGGPITPGGGAPGVPPAPSGGGNAGQNPIKPSDLVGAPMRIASLADGVRNPQLKDLLSSAEDLMRHDKFASAAEKYDAALQLTNNTNPMVLLGRANAELGAEFYGRAEADLRRAVAQDSSLLMGQYDLTKMMDPKRIDAVRDDLQTLAKDTKSVRPPLLLAYLQYNTGHETDAAKSLAQAESLVGNNDPVVELMRTHWSFQSPQVKPGDMNK